MKAIILAAGYATRLYPLTKNKPKPLLEVGNRPIIDYIFDKLDAIHEIDEIFVVTNNKFYSNFQKWASQKDNTKKITVVNDQTISNDDRLGSLGDVRYVLDHEKIDDDIIVLAGDNLFDFSLEEPFNIFKNKNKSVVVLYDVKDIELAKHYGIVEIDENNKMIDFEEKPQNPKSTLSSTGIYIYPKEIKDVLIKYVEENGQNDKAGNFLEWLHKNDEVYCHVTKNKWIDIGTLDQLKKAKEEFKS